MVQLQVFSTHDIKKGFECLDSREIPMMKSGMYYVLNMDTPDSRRFSPKI